MERIPFSVMNGFPLHLKLKNEELDKEALESKLPLIDPFRRTQTLPPFQDLVEFDDPPFGIPTPESPDGILQSPPLLSPFGEIFDYDSDTSSERTSSPPLCDYDASDEELDNPEPTLNFHAASL